MQVKDLLVSAALLGSRTRLARLRVIIVYPREKEFISLNKSIPVNRLTVEVVMVKRAIIQRGEALQQIEVECPGTPDTSAN
jgi:hypothetical protein